MASTHIGYGTSEGFLLAANIATLAAGATQNTASTSVIVNVPDDVAAIVFEGRATASVAAPGQSVRFDLQAQVIEGATYQTNPISVRCPLVKSGYNSGPVDPVNLRLVRRFRLGLVQNESVTATATKVNIYYRLIR